MKKSQLKQIIKEEISKSLVENEQWTHGDAQSVFNQYLLTRKTLVNAAGHMGKLQKLLDKHSNKPQGGVLSSWVPDDYQIWDIMNKMDNFNKGLHAMFPHLGRPKGVNEDEIDFSEEEMNKLHKDGQLKKGGHSFKYKG